MGQLFRPLVSAWDRFWFRPGDPTMLGIIRILSGAIVLYTHVVWTFEFESFYSNDYLLPLEHNRVMTGTVFAWSHFHWISSPSLLWGIHYFALAMMTGYFLGIATRLTSLATLFFTVSYANRAFGATFGLDQINAMLVFYCTLGPSGAVLSVDRLLASRRGGSQELQPTTLANVATRMLQIHLCIIYLFAGWGKLLGSSWWNGDALWGAMANAEYQTLDMTWLAAYPYVINLLTLTALVWEVSYVFLVWQTWARPFVIMMAVAVHLGIGVSMGMMEFGLIMVTANLIFVSPQFTRRVLAAIGIHLPKPSPRVDA